MSNNHVDERRDTAWKKNQIASISNRFPMRVSLLAPNFSGRTTSKAKSSAREQAIPKKRSICVCPGHVQEYGWSNEEKKNEI
jgi:hypothetical protein